MSTTTNLTELPAVHGVGANQVFTVEPPVGVLAYELNGFELSGTTFDKSHISDIDVLVAGKPMQQFLTSAHMENISKYYGYDVNPKELIFPYRREHLLNRAQADYFNFGMANVSVFQIRGKCSAAVSSDARIDAFALETLNTDSSGQPTVTANELGMITKIPNFSHSLVGSGTTEISNIPRESALQAMHIMQANGNVTDVEVWADRRLVWKASDSRMERVVERAGRVRQANVYHCDWQMKNELGGELVLAGLQDFRIKIKHSGDDQIVIYPEYHSTWVGI